MENFIIKLQAMLDTANSKKHINSEIRELQKSINMLRLTASLMKGESKKSINQTINQMETQLNQVKLKAKIDQKNLKADVQKALGSISFKDIDMNFNSGKAILKAKKIVADAQKIIENSPISVNIELKKEKLDNQLTAYLSKNSKIKESQGLLKEMDKLRQKISQINDKDSLRNASDSFQLFKNQVQATGYQTKSASDRIKGLVGNVSKIGSAFGVASVVLSNFQKSLKTIKLNDDLITEISKSSNSTKKELDELVNSAFQTASKYGQPSSDYLTAIQQMNRSGFYGEAGKALGELSLKAQAAGNLSADTAQKYLLAASAAYDYKGSIQQLSTVLDGQNAITNAHSVDLETMASATTRAGSVAANAGVKIEELSAMIATISARTKETGDETGTGIMSLLKNLQNVSSDTIVDTLNKANVSMTETVNGIERLRNPIEILKDLAKTYNSLDASDPLKSEITTNIGEEYHANQLSALLSSWDMYEKMLKTYAEGTGSADIEVQKTAGSLSGRLNTLQNSWDSLVNTITNKEALKDGISLFDGLVNTAEKLIDVFDVIPVAFAGITAFKTAKNKDYGITKIFDRDSGKLDIEGNFMGIDFTQIKHFRDASEAISDWNQKLKNGFTDLDTLKNKTVQNNAQLKDYLKTCSVDAPASLEGYKQHLQAAGIETKSLRAGTMLLNTALSFGIGMAVQGVITGIATVIDNYANRVIYAQERLNEFYNAVTESKNDLKTQEQWIEEHGKRYEELSHGVDNYGHAISLTADEISEYNSLTKDIERMFPNMISGYNDQNQAIVKTKGNIDALTESYKQNVEAAYAATLTKSGDSFDDYKTAIEDDEEVKEIAEQIISANKITRIVDSRGIESFKINDKNVDIKKILSDDEYKKLIGETIKFDMKTAGNSILTEFNFDDLSKELQQKIRAALITANAAIKTETAKVKPLLEAFVYGNSGKDSGYSELGEEGKQVIRNVISSLDDAFYEQFDSDSDMASFFYTNFIDPLKDGLDNTDLAVKINTLFSLNQNNYKSYQDYVNAVNDIINQIKGYKDNDGNPLYSDEQITGLQNVLGVGKINTSGQLSGQSLIDTVKGKYSSITDADKFISTLSEKELRVLYGLKPNESKSLDDLKNAIDKAKTETKTQTDSSPITFSKAWSGLNESDQNALKKETLEGVLDQDSIREFQDLSDNFSLQQIRDEILSLIPLDDKLAQFIDDSGKLTAAYSEMKKNKAVSTKTLLEMPEGIQRLKGYTDFRNTVSDTKTSRETKTDAFEDIITEYLKANQTIVDASGETKNFVVDALKDAGIINAETLVDDVINCKDTITEVMSEIDAANDTDVKNFAKACSAKNLNNTNLYNSIGENTAYMLNQLKDNYAADVRNFGKALQNKLKAEKEYAAAVLEMEGVANGGTSNAAMASFFGMSGGAMSPSTDPEAYKKYKSAKKKLDKSNKAYKKTLAKLKKNLEKINITKIDYDPIAKDGSGQKNEPAKKTKTEIDWITRLIEHTTTKIDIFKAKLQNLFTVKAKNSNLNKQLKQTTKLINAYGTAVKKYTKKADSVKFSSGLKKQVREGKIKGKPKDLIKKYGEKTANKIQAYQNWYDKAQDAKKNKEAQITAKRELEQQKLQNHVDKYNASAGLAELQAENAIGYEKQNGFIRTQLSYLQKSYAKQIEIAKLTNDKTEQERLQAEYEAKKVDLQKQQIDNIKAEYENKISHINNGKQNISNSLSETEARGNIVQAAFYSSLNSYEEQVLAELNEERGELLAQQNTFTQYSPKWYDLQSDIQSVENSISETNISIIENSKKIGELKKAMYDDIASRNSEVSSEAQFLAGLLGDALTDDKTGRLTKEGFGVLGTYGIELEANANTAGVFRQEREEIEKAIAAFHSGDPHALDLYGSLTAAKKELNEIIKKQQEAAASEYESKKKIYDIMVQMYNTQLAYMSSIINAKKQVLDMEKDLYDYERNINSQTKNIAAMEKQLASLKGDDSEEGRARRAKLQSALDEANQNLQDTEYERYISDQQNMLGNMYTQYEDLLTTLEKDFETIVKNGILTINTTAGGISQTLKDIAEKYGYVTSEDMSSIMNSFKDTGLTKLESIFNNLANEIRNGYNSGSGTGNSNGGSGLSGQRGGDIDTNPPGGTPNRDTVIEQGKTDAENAQTQKNDLKKILANADYAKKAAKSPEKYKSRLNQILAKETGYVVTINDGYTASKFLQALNGNGSGSAKPGKDGSYYAKDGNIYKKLQEKYPLIGFRTGGIVRTSGVPKNGDHVPVRVNPDETILTKDFTEMLPDTVETMKGLSRTAFMGNVKLSTDQIKDLAAFVNRPDHTPNLLSIGMSKAYDDKIQEIGSFIKNVDQTRNMQRNPVSSNQNISIDRIKLELPNVKDYRSFREEMKQDSLSRRMAECIFNDCARHGKITQSIQKF